MSVHPVEELKGSPETCDLGSSCIIAFHKKLYTRKIASFCLLIFNLLTVLIKICTMCILQSIVSN